MNEKVIREYYAAYEKKDWHMLELILDDGFTFTSPAGDNQISLKDSKDLIRANSQWDQTTTLPHINAQSPKGDPSKDKNAQ